MSNPEALKGHEGHEVKIKAHEDSAENKLHVTSVKMKGEKRETMKKDEMLKCFSAIRREPSPGQSGALLFVSVEITSSFLLRIESLRAMGRPFVDK